MKKNIQMIALFLLVVTLVGGCTSVPGAYKSYPAPVSVSKGRINQRQLIRTADLEISTYDIKKAVVSVKKAVKGNDGYFSQSNIKEEESAYMKIVVPADKLDVTLAALKKCGTELECNTYVYDVTSKISDLDAVLKNKKALRERLRNLLKKASKVSEVLEVEEELTRLQIEIDKMEGSLKTLRNEVANSKITLRIRKHRILGPLGYVFKGLFWTVSKLFVISN